MREKQVRLKFSPQYVHNGHGSMVGREAWTRRDTTVENGRILLEFTRNESSDLKQEHVLLSDLTSAVPRKTNKGMQGQIVVFEGELANSILDVRNLVRASGGKHAPITEVRGYRTTDPFPKRMHVVPAASCTRVDDFDA